MNKAIHSVYFNVLNKLFRKLLRTRVRQAGSLMEKKMELYLVHCGFYDPTLGEGIFEAHMNLFVAGESFADARERIKEHPEFRKRGLHVDGLQRIEQVQGFDIQLTKQDPNHHGTRVVFFSPNAKSQQMSP